jgi:hypothetical protein
VGSVSDPLLGAKTKKDLQNFNLKVKGKKVKLSLCLINQALCHEGILGVEVQLHHS